MRKLRFLLLMLCAGCMVGHAQITTGESSSRVVRTGNRAQAGDFGLYLGGTSTIFKNFDNMDNFDFLPLINVKYMFTDKVEGRVGIEWWRESNTSEVKVPNYNEEGEEDGSETVENTNFESSMMFYPGIAYHFSNTNLLDVYVGAELPIGWGSYGSEDDEDEYKTSQFRFGLGAFVGLQAYIGNLPLALGVEYGISTLYNSTSDGTLTKDGRTIDKAAGYQEDVSNSSWKLGHQARVTLTYFFKL